MNLEQSLIDQYNKNGVTVIRNAISPYWLKKLSIGIEKNFKDPSKYKCIYEKSDGKEIFFDDYGNWQRIKEYKDFFFSSNIANIAAQIMQSKKSQYFS